MLSKMADRFDAHAEELGTLVTKEIGKKLDQGTFESTTAGATFRHTAGQVLTGDRHLRRGRARTVVQHLRGASGRRRDHRHLERDGRPVHPVHSLLRSPPGTPSRRKERPDSMPRSCWNKVRVMTSEFESA